MTAKEYLSQISSLEGQIQVYLYDIERIEALATKTTGTIKNDRVQASVNQQKMEAAVVKLDDYKGKLAMTLNIYIDAKAEIMAQIDALDDKTENQIYKDILRKRYIERLSLEEIAVKKHYSYRHTTRMHGAALQAFAEQYEEYL